MADPISSLDEELLRALRRAPDRTLSQLADDVGPRTNFGRVLTRRLRDPVDRLVETGLIEESGGQYRLSTGGRRALGERTFEVGESPE